MFYAFVILLSLSFFISIDNVKASSYGLWNYDYSYSGYSQFTKEYIEYVVKRIDYKMGRENNTARTMYFLVDPVTIQAFYVTNGNVNSIKLLPNWWTSNQTLTIQLKATSSSNLPSGTKVIYDITTDSLGATSTFQTFADNSTYGNITTPSTYWELTSSKNYSITYPILLYDTRSTKPSVDDSYFNVSFDGKSDATIWKTYYEYLGESKIDTPTFENTYIKGYVTSDDKTDNVASLLDIDFGIYDTSQYDYYISTNDATSWENVTKYMTNSHFIQTMVRNGTVIARIVSKSNGDEKSSSYTISSINEKAHNDFVKFNIVDKKYIEVNGEKYLQSVSLSVDTYFNYELYNFPFMYSVSIDGAKTWGNNLVYYTFDKNGSIIVKIMDRYGRDLQLYLTHTVTGLDDIESIGENIIFSEECDNNECSVSVTFTNYTSAHRYWVKNDSSPYEEINISSHHGIYHFISTSEMKTYCAKITDLNGNLIQDKCFMTSGVSNDSSTVSKNFDNIFKNFRTNIVNILDLISRFYNGLPSGVQNMFYVILFLILATFVIKFFI